MISWSAVGVVVDNLLRNLRRLALAGAGRTLVGRRLPSGSFVPARAFAAGESLWLAPELAAALPHEADVIVTRDRAWLDAGATSVVARVRIAAGSDPVLLIDSLAPGGYDVFIDLDRDGAWDPGESIEGGGGPGITVVGDPAAPGPFAIASRELSFGLALGVPAGGLYVHPTTAPRGLAIIGHGNGYSRIYTVPLGELLASWGIAAIVLDIPTNSPARVAIVQAAITGAQAAIGLDGRAAILLGHSASGGAVIEIALGREAGWPVPGLVLLSEAAGWLRPFSATPILALIGNTAEFGAVGLGTGQSPYLGTSVAALSNAPTTAVVVEQAQHSDFTYPATSGSQGGDLPYVAPEGADRRRYVAGLACAFCRRTLFDETALDVFLVEGHVAVPGVTSRVAARVTRALRHTVDEGDPVHLPRTAAGRATASDQPVRILDINLVDIARGIWFVADAPGGSVEWTIPRGFAAGASVLSLRVAQVVDVVGIGLNQSTSEVLDLLARGDALPGLASLGIEVAGRIVTVEVGRRWALVTPQGRSYRLELVDGVIRCTAAIQRNVPARDRRLAVVLGDASGRLGELELQIPRPLLPIALIEPAVSAYTSYHLPLVAFGVDPLAITTLALRAGDPMELAIDAVEFVFES